ncbi:MAG: tetratricopeptide repeat protein [Polyangiaceae bacterium]
MTLRRAVALTLTLSILVATSCQSYDAGARAQFAQAATCKPEQIVVTEQPGAPVPPSNPPPEVAADPGQLAIWRRDDQERRADAAATVYVAKGCGQEKHYTCGRSDRHLSTAVCTELVIDPNGAATPPTEADLRKCASAPTRPIEPAEKRAPGAKHCTLGEASGCDSACKASDAESCAILGKMYGEGISVDADLDKSKDLLALACGAGSARGCNSLGVVHDFGHGVPADPAAAIPFYDQACTWGYADACANLAGHYANGSGTKPDKAKAVDFSKKACAWGSLAGCKRLGAFYLGGIGITKDGDCAKIAFRKACSGGDASACDFAKPDAAKK